MVETVNVAEYLYTRLHQLGVRALHGVPGDFNLLALDYTAKCGLNWVCNCNELNAAYAADGYARIKGIGALVTTFGVGELSAINGIAGAYSEFVPVVHIAGVPSTKSQRDGMLLHHTLGNGNFQTFMDMYKHVTVAQANLNDPITAAAEIDRVLRTCHVEARPVYIALPADIVEQQIDATPLQTPLDLSTPRNNPEAEDHLVKLILEKLYAAKRPVVLVDAGAHRHNVLPETDALVRKCGLPTVVPPMGKSFVNETLPNFLGVYIGDGSRPEIRQYVEDSDLVLTIGNVKTDLNTYGFTFRISRLHSIDLHYDNCLVDYARYDDMHMKYVLQSLTRALDPSKLGPNSRTMPTLHKSTLAVDDAEHPPDSITHAYLWPRISSWLRPDDIVITETGTSFVGIWGTDFPAGVLAITQTMWSSIGYGVGATEGAAMAAKEAGRGQRTIVFEGDGSFQTTAQELSTIIAHGLRVTMFLIENGGYTIERHIHGMDAEYNDVPQWRYSQIPEALTPVGGKSKVKTFKISTRTELEALFNDPCFADGEGLQFVEMHMPRVDAPKALREFAATTQKKPA